ncbi:hypothetical protein [Celeribacter sp.]|uniref:hypothetical protein n=1 Tax=Celeribacter sp. TaxID=1890673 RepID=UPI003A8D3072
MTKPSTKVGGFRLLTNSKLCCCFIIMVIESHYWREDLKRYARSLAPKKKPPRWSERLVVNFEKDVTIALFMVRRLVEAGKFSSKMRDHRVNLLRYRFNGRPHSLIYKDIDELYDLSTEEAVVKDVGFLCNQFIHADFTYALRGGDRNWDGLYTSSDFEKKGWVYWVPVAEIIKVLELAVLDCPSSLSMSYDADKEKWIVQTD